MLAAVHEKGWLGERKEEEGRSGMGEKVFVR